MDAKDLKIGKLYRHKNAVEQDVIVLLDKRKTLDYALKNKTTAFVYVYLDSPDDITETLESEGCEIEGWVEVT